MGGALVPVVPALEPAAGWRDCSLALACLGRAVEAHVDESVVTVYAFDLWGKPIAFGLPGIDRRFEPGHVYWFTIQVRDEPPALRIALPEGTA